MQSDVHGGGCMCGAVRYEARGEPNRVGLCHCVTCRKNTGAPFGGFVIFARDRVRLTGAATGSYESSPEITRHFCPRCGSPVFSEEEGEINVYLGSLDEAERFAPSYELFALRRLPWLPETPEIRTFERFREGPEG
jgi:hypothetical protein